MLDLFPGTANQHTTALTNHELFMHVFRFLLLFPPIFLEEKKNANYKWPCISQGELYVHLKSYGISSGMPWNSPICHCFATMITFNSKLHWRNLISFPSIKTAAVFYRGRKNKHKAKQRVSSNFMLYTAMWLEGFVWCKYGPLPMSARVCMQLKIPSGVFENGPYVPTNTDWFESSGRLLLSFSIHPNINWPLMLTWSSSSKEQCLGRHVLIVFHSLLLSPFLCKGGSILLVHPSLWTVAAYTVSIVYCFFCLLSVCVCDFF